MTTTATTSATTSIDIPWEGDDGNEKSDSIVESKSNSCSIAQVPVIDDTEIHSIVAEVVGDKSILDIQASHHGKPEDLVDIIANDSERSNDACLKRKASNSLEEISAIPMDTDLNEEELQDQVVTDNVTTNAAPALGTAEGNNKRARRIVPSRISWEERMAALIAFKEEHGHLQIPIRYKKNLSLGKFVHNTREQYKLFHNQSKSGYQKRCSLTIERINDLNSIGFIWTTERIKKQNDDWNSRLEQLKEYKALHGDCMVPHGYEADPSFAEWIHRQRTSYASIVKDEKPNPLVQSRIAKLEEIGFNFTVHTDKWMDQYNMLKAYKEKHGDCQVPTHYAENPKLGRWTHTQRHQRRLKSKLYKKSAISQERIALLDDLGFNWEVRPPIEQPRATWQQRYDELVEYYTNNGNFLISPETYPKLYRWCCEQRSRLNKLESLSSMSIATEGSSAADGGISRRMGEDRLKLLTDIGFTSNTTLAKAKRSSIDMQDNENVVCNAQQTSIESNYLGETEAHVPFVLEGKKSDSVLQMHANEQDDEKNSLV